MIISRDWQEVSVLECILSGLHIDVDVESELERAWIRLRKSRVDAIIVDCDSDGTRHFLRKLRTTLPGAAPIIIAGCRNDQGAVGPSVGYRIVRSIIEIAAAEAHINYVATIPHRSIKRF